MIESLQEEARREGLALRGAFHPDPHDQVPEVTAGVPAATLVLFGNIGASHWPAFRASAEASDGQADPLDRWSRRILGTLAVRFEASPLFPFGGPPWLPFQRWAMRAESVHASPLGILIHPRWGLWHAYRGALALPVQVELPRSEIAPSPCDACLAKPCLSSCPVDAVAPRHFDAASCRDDLHAPAGIDCMQRGCLARRSCPIGAQFQYPDEQAHFHAIAFRASR